jgi:N-terminal domain of anti-restriction factor ArdC
MDNQTKWSDLLKAAVEEPGLILRAYSAFYGYSLGNQLAALVQCNLRGIQPGPINTYPGWKKLNRQVKKGEKAIWLCMPLTRKLKNEAGEDEKVIATFVWKPNWFVLYQTEGDSIPMPEIPTWNKEKAMATLGIQEIAFTDTNGNVQGYARKRDVAISPLAEIPHKTLFHELAHIELGHTVENEFTDSELTPRTLKEVEAEAVAMLLCESLELPGSEYCRGYIQNWLKGDAIPEKSAMKIFGAADRILKAGYVDNALR